MAGLVWVRFKRRSSLEACLLYCNQEKVTEQNCPCSKLFEGKMTMATELEVIDYALMAGASYISTRKSLNHFPVPVASGWSELEDERKGRDVGFEATAFTKGNNQLVISFAGTYDQDIAGGRRSRRWVGHRRWFDPTSASRKVLPGSQKQHTVQELQHHLDRSQPGWWSSGVGWRLLWGKHHCFRSSTIRQVGPNRPNQRCCNATQGPICWPVATR